MSERSGIRRYWDSKCFIALLNDEPAAATCERILEEAKERQTEICVSPIVQLEVIRPKGAPRPLAKGLRDKVRAFFENDYIRLRVVDRKIANDAQELCWDYALHSTRRHPPRRRNRLEVRPAGDLGQAPSEIRQEDFLNVTENLRARYHRPIRPIRSALTNVTPRKKLIEVALPLDAINKASAREKSIRHGIRVRCICGGRGGRWRRQGR